MEIFLTSIQSIVPIIVIIILGYFLQVRGWFQESFGNDLSKLIMTWPCLLQFLPLFLNI